MDNNFDLIVYILFIVASIVGGIIQNNNKKKAEVKRQQRKAEFNPYEEKQVTNMPPESTPPIPTNPLEEFLRRTLEEFQEPAYEEEKPVPTPAIEQMVPKAEIKPEIIDYTAEGAEAFEATKNESFSKNIFDQNITLSSLIKDADRFEYTLPPTDNTDNENALEPEFDAREAVIYSEILKPKYI
jgi:hypothetical protein